MKKILARFVMLLTIGFTFLNGSCDKDSDPGKEPAPSLAVDGARFLCTIGFNSDGLSDTLVYRYRPTLTDMMGRYDPVYSEEKNKVKFEREGSNSNIYHIVFNTPYNGAPGVSYPYLGISDKLNLAFALSDCEYEFRGKAAIGDDTKFIIVGDANGFTIESKKYPGLYLQPKKWKNSTTPGQGFLAFCAGRHTFFLLNK